MPTVREASALLRAPPSGGKADGSNPGRVHGPDVESRGASGQQKDGASSGRVSVLKERLREPQLPACDDESDAGLRVYCEDGSGKRTYATLRVRPRARFAAAPRRVSLDACSGAWRAQTGARSAKARARAAC
jgi:hypothetical protein